MRVRLWNSNLRVDPAKVRAWRRRSKPLPRVNRKRIRIAPDTARAWHAGRCRPSSDQLGYTDANSAFYGIAVATNGQVDVTPLQTLTTAWLTRLYFESHGWPLTELWRIVGHETEAWPRGRKKDPSGGLGSNPILTVDDIRQLVPRIQP